MDKIFLIVGSGNMGRRYIDMLNERYPGCRIEVKTRNDSFYAFRDFLFDAAFICTPSYTHLTLASEMFNTLGPIPTLIEKPLTTEVESDQSIIDYLSCESMEANVAIYTAYNLRFTENISYAISYLNEQNKLYGIRPLAVCKTNSFTWRGLRAKDHVRYELSHEVDYLEHLFGKIEYSEEIGGKTKLIQRNVHESGVRSTAYISMSETWKTVRYFTVDPQDRISKRFEFTADDIRASYHSQLTYFMQERYNPYIMNGIFECLKVDNRSEILTSLREGVPVKGE